MTYQFEAAHASLAPLGGLSRVLHPIVESLISQMRCIWR